MLIMKKPPNSALFLLDMGSQAASNLPFSLFSSQWDYGVIRVNEFHSSWGILNELIGAC